MQQSGFTPGKPAVELICAAGPVGRRLLEEIAHPAVNPTNHREFGRWIGNECAGVIFAKGVAVPLSLLIGEETNGKRALVIEEVPGGRLSLKPLSSGNGKLVLRVNRDFLERRLQSFASQVVATFVIHGFGWRDRRGREYAEPYGPAPSTAPKRKRHRGGRGDRLTNHHYF